MNYDARIGRVLHYGCTLEDARAWMRGWLVEVAKHTALGSDCCRKVNGGTSCLELYRRNLSRARIEVAHHERIERIQTN